MSQDPTETDGDLYTTISEHERVRVLEYRDTPGTRTHHVGTTDTPVLFAELK